MKLENILKIVSDYYSVPESDLKGDSRQKDIIKARHVYFYLSWMLTENSFSKIGSLVDKEHCTVMHGKSKIYDQIHIYKELSEEVEELKSIIRPKNKLVIEHLDLLELSHNYTKSFLTA